MSNQSKMYHSIIFGDKNTWDDWGLIPSSRPKFSTPQKKTNYIDIPGANSVLDMSQSLTGFPVYSNREGSFEFYVQNEKKSWYELYSEISDYLHGMKRKAILEDDPDYYYEGVFSVQDWDSHNDGTGSVITISYTVKPYKLSNHVTNLNFTVGGTLTEDISDKILRMPVCPEITASNGDITLRYTEPSTGRYSSQQLKSGTYTYDAVTLCNLYYPVSVWFSGNGTVSMTFRNGRL